MSAEKASSSTHDDKRLQVQSTISIDEASGEQRTARLLGTAFQTGTMVVAGLVLVDDSLQLTEARQDAGQLRDQHYHDHLDPVVRRFGEDDQATGPGSGDSSVLTLLFPCIRLSRDGMHKVVRLRRSC